MVVISKTLKVTEPIPSEFDLSTDDKDSDKSHFEYVF